MTIPVNVRDPGNGRALRIAEEGQAEVVVHPHPPRGEQIISLPFRQYFTDDGTGAGSNDMKVDGSTVAANFFISAENKDLDNGGKDRYIKTISFIISDNGARLNLFGALAALTNGVQFKHITNDNGTVDILNGEDLKTNLDIVRLCLGTPPVGSGTDVFRADISGSGADSYLPTLDFAITFGLPWGLRLRAGTNDKLTFIINDDITGLDTFNVIGAGTQL